VRSSRIISWESKRRWPARRQPWPPAPWRLPAGGAKLVNIPASAAAPPVANSRMRSRSAAIPSPVSADVASAGKSPQSGRPLASGRFRIRSLLFTATSAGRPSTAASNRRSSSFIGSVASSTITTSAASARASRLRRMPNCSASSRPSRKPSCKPAVSTSLQRNALQRNSLGNRVASGAGVAVHNGPVALHERLKSELLPRWAVPQSPASARRGQCAHEQRSPPVP